MQLAAHAGLMCTRQVTMLLETEEVIALECRPAGRSPGSAVIRKLYCEQQEITADTLLTHFLFTIPGSAPPSFRTPMVALQWMLRFEITTGVVTFGKEGEKVVKPAAETLLWSLPLVVHPPIRSG
jgi:RAB6A-GEF complex partner protein 2